MAARAVNRIERLRDVGGATRLEDLRADAKSLRRRLDRLALQRPSARIPKHPDTLERWNGFDEQLQALCAEFRKIQEHTADVAARARKARDQAAGPRIGFKVDRDYGNAGGGAGCCLQGRRSYCHYGIHSVVDEVGCQCRQTREIAVGKTDNQLDTRVALVIRTIQSLPDCRNTRAYGRRLPGVQQPELARSRRLLRARRERPRRRRAAEKRDELAPLHARRDRRLSRRLRLYHANL